jgi:Flp pilus assembly protein TadG
MSGCFHFRRRRAHAFLGLWADNRASQIVEFALSLPLLVFFVVGIFDFSGALSLKQKLTNAAREGARVAAADPASDLGATRPVSVLDAFWVVDNYLISEKINDCGLNGTAPTGTGLIWASNTASCPALGLSTGISLTINRGCITQPTINGATVNVVSTCVTIQYPYKWQYSSVTGLLGITFIGPSTITTTATAFNEN